MIFSIFGRGFYPVLLNMDVLIVTGFCFGDTTLEWKEVKCKQIRR